MHNDIDININMIYDIAMRWQVKSAAGLVKHAAEKIKERRRIE
jgi:hypothetical protein